MAAPTQRRVLKPTIYTSTFIHTPRLGEIEVLQACRIWVDESGRILRMGKFGESRGEGEEGGWDRVDVDEVAVRKEREGVNGGDEKKQRRTRRWWVPGFVDTHTHPSQHPNAGIFGKSTLLDWLETYTFPLESSLSDPQRALQVYSAYVSSSLAHGTTTAAYYATASASSTNILASICHERGQRAFIGRCNMDTDLQPDYYRDKSPEQALKDTNETIDFIKGLDPEYDIVSPIITPRFAPSCSPKLLSLLGQLAQEHNLPIQTHISENRNEIALVQKLFPDHSSYADVYDAHKLLTQRTVLAHGVHLTAAERALIRERGSSVSHCPVSNSSLSSGICWVRRLLDEGVTVGLGTDVSGGFSPSVLTAAREAAVVSRILAGQVGWSQYAEEEERADKMVDSSRVVATQHEQRNEIEKGREESMAEEKRERIKLSPEEVVYLATLGGAKCIGLESRIGTFEVGKQFDAQLIEVEEVNLEDDDAVEGGAGVTTADDGSSTRDDLGTVRFWGKESWEDRVAKWIFCGDDRNTRRVYVKGRLVHERR